MNAAVGEIKKLNEQLSQLRQETRDQREKICQMLVRPFFIRLALMNHDEKNCHLFPKNKKAHSCCSGQVWSREARSAESARFLEDKTNDQESKAAISRI